MVIKEMGKALKFGLMGPNMMDNGLITKHAGKEHFITSTAIPTSENGQMTGLMDMEYISNKMVQYIKGNGKMIISMVSEKNNVH